MISKILEFADEYEMLPPGSTVLVCVSGGADSMCLLEVMRHISYRRKLAVAAAHYNHMLRGKESDRDETFVMNICETHGIPLYSAGSDIAHYAKTQSVGVEEAARDVRYSFFQDTAEKIGASRIATAHTMDDNAETMIMNIIRGAGSNGLAGIPPVRDNIIRPLLNTSRDEILEFLAERNVPYVDDSSNNSDIYTRNKIRHKIIPVFEEINPRFIEAAYSASVLSRADEEFISEIADMFISDCCVGSIANASDLAALPFSVSSRVVRKLCGLRTLSHAHVRDVLALCVSENPSAGLSLPGMEVYREYENIVFNNRPKSEALEFAPVYPVPGGKYIILCLGLSISCSTVIYTTVYEQASVNKSFSSFYFKSVDICGKITVRPRREGDSVRFKGQRGSKTLKKLFIEKRIPVRKRAQIPVICDDDGVLGIYGMGVSDRAVPQPGDEAVMITFKENR